MTASQISLRRRKNSISAGRLKVSMALMMPLQRVHRSGSAPQTLRMRSRQSGRMARAVTFCGGGTMGVFGAGCFSPMGSTSAMFRRGRPRLLFE